MALIWINYSVNQSGVFVIFVFFTCYAVLFEAYWKSCDLQHQIYCPDVRPEDKKNHESKTNIK